MRAGAVAGHNSPQRVQHRGRRFVTWIAERKVEDSVGPALALQPGTFLKHASNPGGVLELVGDGIGDGHRSREAFYLCNSSALAKHVDSRCLQALDGRVRIAEAEDEDGLVATAEGKGVHVLDVDRGAFKDGQYLRQSARPVRHFHGEHLGHFDENPCASSRLVASGQSETIMRRMPKRWVSASDERPDVDAFPRQQPARSKMFPVYFPQTTTSVGSS